MTKTTDRLKEIAKKIRQDFTARDAARDLTGAGARDIAEDATWSAWHATWAASYAARYAARAATRAAVKTAAGRTSYDAAWAVQNAHLARRLWHGMFGAAHV